MMRLMNAFRWLKRAREAGYTREKCELDAVFF